MSNKIKLSKPQIVLLTLLRDNPDMQLGEIRQKYFNISDPDSMNLSNEMKRNSKMCSWLNYLEEKGLIRVSRFSKVTYCASQKAIDLL